MIRLSVAAVALLLAACGRPAATTEEAPAAAPQSLLEQVNAMTPENQPVFAYQQLIAYQQAHPELTPACTSVRGTERIAIPETIAADSIYAPHREAAVFTVQCGELRSRARMDFNEKWLVVFAPGADAVTVQNCAGPRQSDLCMRPQAAPAAPATTTP